MRYVLSLSLSYRVIFIIISIFSLLLLLFLFIYIIIIIIIIIKFNLSYADELQNIIRFFFHLVTLGFVTFGLSLLRSSPRKKMASAPHTTPLTFLNIENI